MIYQFTVTVAEAKRLIAKAIGVMPSVKKALSSGRVFLKGGTTVSAVSEELGGPPLRISGRISPSGTRAALEQVNAPHCLVFERGVPLAADGRLEEVVYSLGPEDVAVLGANLIDSRGGAAMMAGAALGGPPGRVLAGLAAQGTQVLIACGLEKLFPGCIEDAVNACGRSKVDRAMGMAVGLIPVYGRVITEVEACRVLAVVEVQVVGRGGVSGCEGGTTLVAEGEAEDISRLMEIVNSVKGAGTSGVPESMVECRPGCESCRRHRACAYRISKER
ncbi:MAG: hypothetical protein HPY55_02710 [Firmicutes bacterium]|nr:hypothetical protein [Bacillota bacterium]